MFSNLLMGLAAWALKQSLGTKKGSAAVAHAAPVLKPLADAAGHAAEVKIGQAAATNGNLTAVVDLVRAAQGGQH